MCMREIKSVCAFFFMLACDCSLRVCICVSVFVLVCVSVYMCVCVYLAALLCACVFVRTRVIVLFGFTTARLCMSVRD
jgi:hypothetical protein